MKTIQWVLINGLFATLMYVAFIMKIEPAERVLLFFAWFTIIPSPFLLTEPAIKEIYKKRKISSSMA